MAGSKKIDYEFFDSDYESFMKNTVYYQSKNHSKFCKICKLPKEIRKSIDKKLLAGENPATIATYLQTHYPDMLTNPKNYYKMVKTHLKYLPGLLDDVQVKSIFKRARSIIENRNINDMTPDEKAQAISEIEAEICKEYQDVENERISMLNLLFKDIIPLMLERLEQEITVGQARDVKDITSATETIWKISNAMAAANIQEEDKKEDEVDFSKLDETGNGKNTNKKILSLADKITKATSG